MGRPEKRVLVTGATGHLGANLVRQLSAEGFAVRALSRGHLPAEALDGIADVELCSGDVTNPETLSSVMRDIDLVYHLAAKISLAGDPDGSVWRTNVAGTQHVLRAASRHGVRRLVYCGSVHAFDYTDGDLKEINEGTLLVSDDSAAPAYDRSKAAAQREVLRAVEDGLDAVIVQPSGVIGPHDYAPSPMGQVFLDLAARRVPALVRGGFDFVDARDVARAMVRAAATGRRGQNYLLSGAFATIRELAIVAANVTGVTAPRVTIPRGLAHAVAPLVEFRARLTSQSPRFTAESLRTLALKAQFSSMLAATELGFRPRPLFESVRDIYQDFARRGLWSAPPETSVSPS